ncbi:metalloregulator ArsR/SmtB family transcription factor [Slackia heliotrinireducens]|uniref:metalloregulator ArsR/SmtB family transcription factor n=1 Tax=Slackia heliotrinireducens TaxID=84110 RepID=UPI003315D195
MADLESLFKALGEPTRLKIVRLLTERHHCARSLSQTLGISEPAVSQHMTVLKRVGLVSSYRHGYHMHYVLNTEALAELSDELHLWQERAENVLSCHSQQESCAYLLGDGTSGCLYGIANAAEPIDAKKSETNSGEASQTEPDERTSMKIAIPSETDAGLQSVRSGHFGHAPYFTIVTIEDRQVKDVEVVKNVDHDQYGCGGVIQYALTLGIDGILTVGMGMPPYTAFTNNGITVYSETNTPMVGDVAQLFALGLVMPMDPNKACRH